MKKVQYDINHENANASALVSGKTDEFEKQIKAIEDQGTKQVEALKALKSEENQIN